MKKAEATDSRTASQHITNQIAELADWRGKMLARLRKVILAAAPGLTEEWKWGTAVLVAAGQCRGGRCVQGPSEDQLLSRVRYWMIRTACSTPVSMLK